MNAKITITGPAVCPLCPMLGHDADSCRNGHQLSDGRIVCGNCASYVTPVGDHAAKLSSMPYPIKTVVAVLLRESKHHTPPLKLAMASFGPDGSSTQAAYACAQGNEGVILNGGYLLFSADGYSRLAVRFQADELQAVPEDFSRITKHELDHASVAFLSNIRLNSCPLALETAIGKLLGSGFTVHHTDFSSAMRRIVLHCGGNIAGTSVPKGIMVEATYLV